MDQNDCILIQKYLETRLPTARDGNEQAAGTIGQRRRGRQLTLQRSDRGTNKREPKSHTGKSHYKTIREEAQISSTQRYKNLHEKN